MSNEFPAYPVPAVGAITFRDHDVLLVKRGSEPNRGRWSVPGGALEIGETVEQAAIREVLEETCVDVRPREIVDVKDWIVTEEGAVRWHYVLIDVLCEYVRGEPSPASDATDARFISLNELSEYDVTPTALEVVRSAATARGTASLED